MLWVRIDGQQVAGNPTLSPQAEIDKTICGADLSSLTPVETNKWSWGIDSKVEAQRSKAKLDAIKDCMAQKGYAPAPADRAEAVRAQFAQWAAIAAQKAAEQAASAKPPITSKPKKPPRPKTTSSAD
jgi:hypothetical protein